MKINRMGRTGLKVSEICLGCMTFGGQADEKTSFAIMDLSVENGINFFDTANRYVDGRSEEIVGRWLDFIEGLREVEPCAGCMDRQLEDCGWACITGGDSNGL